MYMNIVVDSKLTLPVFKYLPISWKKCIVDLFDSPYDLRSLLGLLASHFISFPCSLRAKGISSQVKVVSYGSQQKLRPQM